MTDIHTHILYGVDDGSDSKETSVYLLTQSKDCGIDKILLTPHQNEEMKRSEELQKLFASFKEDFKNFEIDYYLGSEIYYYPKMIDDLDNHELLTLNNTNYVLVEFSTTTKTEIANIIYDLKVRGYNPIVAHIERYIYLTFDDYNEIKSNGGFIQVNARSFETKIYKKIIKYLLKNKMIDYISSDCHNQRRDVNFDYAKKLIMKKYKDQYDKLFDSVPEFLK